MKHSMPKPVTQQPVSDQPCSLKRQSKSFGWDTPILHTCISPLSTNMADYVTYDLSVLISLMDVKSNVHIHQK